MQTARTLITYYIDSAVQLFLLAVILYGLAPQLFVQQGAGVIAVMIATLLVAGPVQAMLATNVKVLAR